MEKTILNRITEIKPQLASAFREELDGLASVMPLPSNLTREEMIYGYNLIPDIYRTSQCSVLGCWGES